MRRTKAIRDLLHVSNSSAKARKDAATKRAGSVLPTAFKVTNAGSVLACGVYRAKGKIINGSRVYKNHNGYLLKKSKLGGKSCWVIEDVGEKMRRKELHMHVTETEMYLRNSTGSR